MQSSVFLSTTIDLRDQGKTVTIQQNKIHWIKMSGFLSTFYLLQVTGSKRKIKSLVTQPLFPWTLGKLLALQVEQIALNWRKEKIQTQLRHLQNEKGNRQTWWTPPQLQWLWGRRAPRRHLLELGMLPSAISPPAVIQDGWQWGGGVVMRWRSIKGARGQASQSKAL